MFVAKDFESIPDQGTQRFEDMIALQDVPVMESQQPELLPVDLQAELNLRNSLKKDQVAYRLTLFQTVSQTVTDTLNSSKSCGGNDSPLIDLITAWANSSPQLGQKNPPWLCIGPPIAVR